MTAWLLTVLWSCTSEPEPWDHEPRPRTEAFADPRLDATGAGPVWQLYRLEGRYELPQTTLPEGFEATSRFPVTMESEPLKERKATNVYRGESPFRDSVKARVTAPPGMRLYVGDTELKFHAGLRGKSWSIRDGHLLVAWPERPAPGAVAVAWDRARDEFLRRDFGSADLPAAEFVRTSVTIDHRTRDGMLLPAPGTAEWDLELPTGSGASFETWVSMAPLSFEGLRSDGARLSLSVVADGETHEVAARFVDGTPKWERWEVELDRFAGEAITLRLATDPHDTRDFDHVFLGAPTVAADPTGEIRRVVVIGLDTTRPDHFGFYGYERNTTPELDTIAETSSVFMNAWTPAPRTRPSFRTATTGRRPLEAVGARNIGEVFQDHGFATGGIVANVHLQPRFGFHRGFEDWWFDGQAKASVQVDRALEFLARNADRDSYLFLHVMDPHLFYNAPEDYDALFVTDPDPDLPRVFNRWEVYKWMRSGELDERRKAHIVALYDAEMRFMSEHLGRLFDKLDRMPGRTLVVVHNDHGEEFWEHEAFEHNHTLYDDVTRGILWFRSGAGQQPGARLDTPATLADIAPTLYDFADFDDPPPTDGRSLVPALLGEGELGERPLDLGHLRYGQERWGVIWKGHKYVLHTASGTEELYDLSADPGEQQDLSKRTPLAEYRAALSEAHDMPVGRGWRIRVGLAPNTAPVHIELPSPALDAAVIDPEATTDKPVNQAWGEVPKQTPDDIGSVTLDEARTTLTYTPGPDPKGGLLVVRFEGEVPPSDARIRRGKQTWDLPDEPGAITWADGAARLTLEPGTVLLPPPGEAARMAALSEAGDDRAALCALGYLDCEDD